MKFTYTGKALETKLMIEEGRKVYTINITKVFYSNIAPDTIQSMICNTRL